MAGKHPDNLMGSGVVSPRKSPLDDAFGRKHIMPVGNVMFDDKDPHADDGKDGASPKVTGRR